MRGDKGGVVTRPLRAYRASKDRLIPVPAAAVIRKVRRYPDSLGLKGGNKESEECKRGGNASLINNGTRNSDCEGSPPQRY